MVNINLDGQGMPVERMLFNTRLVDRMMVEAMAVNDISVAIAIAHCRTALIMANYTGEYENRPARPGNVQI